MRRYGQPITTAPLLSRLMQDSADARRRLALYTGMDLSLSLSVPHMTPCPRTDWQPDTSSSKCPFCDSDFSLVRRRHHCRRCGRLCCAQCSGPVTTDNGTHFPHVCSLCQELTASSNSRTGNSVTQAQSYILRHASSLIPEDTRSDLETALSNFRLEPSVSVDLDPILLAEALRGIRNACAAEDFRRKMHDTAAGRVIQHVAVSLVSTLYCQHGISDFAIEIGRMGAPLMPVCGGERLAGIQSMASREYVGVAVRHALALCINYSTSYQTSYCVDLVDAGLVGLVLGIMGSQNESVVAELAVWLLRNLSRDARVAQMLPVHEAQHPGTRMRLMSLLSSPSSVSGEFAIVALANILQHDPERLVGWLGAATLSELIPGLIERQPQPVMAASAQLVRVLASVLPLEVGAKSSEIPRRLVAMACSTTDVACSDAAVFSISQILTRCRLVMSRPDGAPAASQPPYFAAQASTESSPTTLNMMSLTQLPDSPSQQDAQTSGRKAYQQLCSAFLACIDSTTLAQLISHGSTGGALSLELVLALISELLRFSQTARIVLAAHESIRMLFSVTTKSSAASVSLARSTNHLFKVAWKHVSPGEPCPFGRERRPSDAGSRPQSLT